MCIHADELKTAKKRIITKASVPKLFLGTLKDEDGPRRKSQAHGLVPGCVPRARASVAAVLITPNLVMLILLRRDFLVEAMG